MDYSILMSVYFKENPDYLDRSLRSMFEQTVKSNDFVLVCDGALTPELDEVISKYHALFPEVFHVVRKDHSGLADSLNYGLRFIKNSIVARMDSDDISAPYRCELELKRLEEGFDIVGSSIVEFSSNEEEICGVRKVPERQKDITKFAKRRNPFNHPSVMIKKELFQKFGGYPAGWTTAEDYCFFYRAIHGGASCYNIQQPLVKMRVGNGSVGRRGKKVNFYIKKLRKEMYKDRFINWFDYFCISPLLYSIRRLPLGLRSLVFRLCFRK